MTTICRPRMSMEIELGSFALSISSMMTTSTHGIAGMNSVAIIEGITHTGRATWTSRG